MFCHYFLQLIQMDDAAFTNTGGKKKEGLCKKILEIFDREQKQSEASTPYVRTRTVQTTTYHYQKSVKPDIKYAEMPEEVAPLKVVKSSKTGQTTASQDQGTVISQLGNMKKAIQERLANLKNLCSGSSINFDDVEQLQLDEEIRAMLDL